MSRGGYRYAWYTVVLLTIAYIFSFVDRYILGLLVQPIKDDLGLSDTEIGLLLGPAFALFYTSMGLPLGWLADRARRTWIVSAGIAIWSLATAACGLARNFGQLFLARVSVGVGEATLSPCALSMIADSFPEERRGKPIAFYSAALTLGAGIASLAGASVLTWSKTVTDIDLPLVGQIAPWQFAFIVVGLPGLPLAVMMFFLREPKRQDLVDMGGRGKAGLSDALRYIARRRRTYVGFTAIVCVMTVVAYSQGWLPAMFERTWGWPTEKYALYNGLTLLFLGPACVNFAGWTSDRLAAAGRRDAPLLIVITGVLILVPTGVLAPLMPTAWAAFIMLQLNTVGIAILSATAPTALLNITPGQIRGQVVALYIIVISIAGLMLGPTSIGIMNDYVFGEEGIRYSTALVPLVIGAPILLTVRGTRRSYVHELEEMQKESS
ncbi:MAG: MFS transporter [Gammaproteobacteria bacterium]|nr:MFS transporter [Gammaproteobacteria bacterium]